MTPGQLVRRLLGDALFGRVVEWYRAIYVDLDEVARCIPVLDSDRELLDLGGGDGALLERVLAKHPGLRATLVDRAASVGLSLSAAGRARTRLLPSSDLADAAAASLPKPDLVIVTDVLHHVPRAERRAFFEALREYMQGRSFRLVVKDVAPEGWRAALGLLSDRYVTGDRGVELLRPDELRALVAETLPWLVPRDTPLFERDRPNYCIVFEPR